MRIGELAERTGVTCDTIRYYERIGLLAPPPRTVGAYRDYPRRAVDDVRFIRKAQASGLRLKDIREVAEIAAGGRLPCEHVRARVTARLADVDRRMREMRTLRSALRATLARLDRTEPTRACRCSAIEAV